MRDPHVEWLQYRLETSDNLTFTDPEPVEVSRPGFTAQLEDLRLTCVMEDHFSEVVQARSHVEPFLRAWEISANLEGPGFIRFAYEDSRLIDRDPPPGDDSTRIRIRDATLTISTLNAAITHGVHQYPEPPAAFRATALVERLWRRLEGYVEGTERLPALSYYCLTELEDGFGGRAPAAQALGVSRQILVTVGKLAGSKGGREARKADGVGDPLTKEEVVWLETALRVLIRRLAEYEAGERRSDTLTMNDLPSI